MWNLNCDTNEPIYETNRLTDIENRLERGGGGKDWECGISRRKLLYREWINEKVLLYSTGNYIFNIL